MIIINLPFFQLTIVLIISNLLCITPEEILPSNQPTENEKKSPDSPSAESPTENTTLQSIVPVTENKLCLSAYPDECPLIEKNQTCQCAKHKTIPDFWVCCNITDLSVISPCNIQPESSIHIINATLSKLDISNSVFQMLNSISITDGRVNSINGSMSLMAYLKCLNVSNNNITEIHERESAFTKLQKFQYIDLSHNNLSFIPKLSTHNNASMDIRDNYVLLCNPLINIIGTIKLIEPNNTFCMYNQSYDWFNFTEPIRISDLERQAELKKECPTNCTCSPDNMNFDRDVSIEG